jgi:hypothetical protein
VIQDPIVRGVVLQADAALRQLTSSQQLEVIDMLRGRIEARNGQHGGEQKFIERGCIGKRRHESKDESERIRVRMPKPERLQSYECQRCGGWHVGHRRTP